MHPTFVRHRQPPETVVAVHIHARVVQHDVWTVLVKVARQALCQTPGAGHRRGRVSVHSEDQNLSRLGLGLNLSQLLTGFNLCLSE